MANSLGVLPGRIADPHLYRVIALVEKSGDFLFQRVERLEAKRQSADIGTDFL